jgi:hypothetical protein
MSEKLQKQALTATDVAALYGIAPGSLANLRCQKRGPKFFKIGRKVVYRPEDCDAYFFSTPVETIDSAGADR